MVGAAASQREGSGRVSGRAEYKYSFNHQGDRSLTVRSLRAWFMPSWHLPASIGDKICLGSFNPYGGEGPVERAGRRLVIVSINVTSLTAARLEESLQVAKGQDASILALQETRHPPGGFVWATRQASKEGWKLQWSKASPLDSCGRRSAGGTALLWKRELGKGEPVKSGSFCKEDEHRSCGRTWSEFCISSVYGNAQGSNIPWFGEIMRTSAGNPRDDKPTFLVGDFNWKAAYDKHICDGWSVVDRTCSVKKGVAAPTRCMHKVVVVQNEAQIDILGIPHHRAMVYRSCIPAPQPGPSLRLRRCAKYQWRTKPNCIEEESLRMAAERAAAKSGYAGNITQAWATWHKRAESVFKAADELELAAQAVKAERPKGSTPTVRRVAETSKKKAPEPIALRRVRKLHAAVQFERCANGGGAQLTTSQLRHWRAFIADGVAKSVVRMPVNQTSAIKALDAAAVEINAKLKEAQREDWKRSLRQWTLAKGARIVKQTTPAPVFSAEEMRADWDKVWRRTPEGSNHGKAWKDQAVKAGLRQVRTRRWNPPSFERFTEALLATSGAAGFDGWEKDEVRALLNHAPWLIEELRLVLIRATRESVHGLPAELKDAMLAWRVVGIPKRDPTESRPIAIASFLLRAWQKAILDEMPEAPDGQWAETGVIPGVADFLAWQDQECLAAAGAELDLAKAYDSVLHDTAAAALEFEGTPREVVAWLREAWTAKRICNVEGELAAPIEPGSGILPGDPTSGRVLALVLKPWHVSMAKHDVKAVAYADDRSIKAVGQTAREADGKVEKALKATAEFDSQVGLMENEKKRQRWKADETAEHLGLNLQLGGPGQGCEAMLPAPRDGWGAIEEGMKRLIMLPGGFEAREAVGRGCFLPKFVWAAPFMQQPPWTVADTMYRQLLRSRCTWWCVARVWADRVTAHPNYALAIQSLKAAVGLPASRVKNAAVKCHAAYIGLRPVFGAGGDFRLAPAADADERAVFAARAAAREELGARSRRTDFEPSSPCGLHAIRVAARIKALELRPRGATGVRKDAEGLRQADIEAMSHPAWKRWMKSLDEEERRCLRVWRGGGIFTPTRRYGGRPGQQSSPLTACRWCEHPWASARHFWQECPHFDAIRWGLEEEYGISREWWQRQPRCTSKTGWITMSASRDAARRAVMQVAACRLGIAIVSSCAPLEDGGDAFRQ